MALTHDGVDSLAATPFPRLTRRGIFLIVCMESWATPPSAWWWVGCILKYLYHCLGGTERGSEGGVSVLAACVMVVFVCVLTLAGFQRAAGRKKEGLLSMRVCVCLDERLSVAECVPP